MKTFIFIVCIKHNKCVFSSCCMDFLFCFHINAVEPSSFKNVQYASLNSKKKPTNKAPASAITTKTIRSNKCINISHILMCVSQMVE